MQINYDIEVKEHTVTVDPQYFNAAIALVFLPTAFVLMGPVAVRSSPNIRTMVTMIQYRFSFRNATNAQLLKNAVTEFSLYCGETLCACSRIA